MRIENRIKQILPENLFYILRDFYASFKDIGKYFTVRREYTKFSSLRNLAGILRSLLFPKVTVLCCPGRPSYYHVFYKMCALTGCKISTNPSKKCDVVFWSHDKTFPNYFEIKPFLDAGIRVINENCSTLSKKIVGEKVEEVFGYSLDVDPTTYQGSIVKKSIYNGTNTAIEMEGPNVDLKREKEYVFQKKINNQAKSEDLTLVYRVPVYAGEIPVVYLKYRPYSSRFTGYYVKVDVKQPDEVFSGDEISKILEMNKKMGIDFGECDVLRDSDGKIYIVDVNSHPGGPPRKMSHQQKLKAANKLIPSFRKLLNQFSR